MSRFSILHLSDAHIGHPLWKTDFTSVMRPLISDIKSVSEKRAPDLIVFSGDLVYGEVKGATMEEQFAEAKMYIILDGLNRQLSPSSANQVADVLGIFESFINTFRFIITLNPEKLPEDFRTIAYRTFPVPRFDKSQCDKYLSEIVSAERKDEIWALIDEIEQWCLEAVHEGRPIFNARLHILFRVPYPRAFSWPFPFDFTFTNVSTSSILITNTVVQP
jgi:hypothetical protein